MVLADAAEFHQQDRSLRGNLETRHARDGGVATQLPRPPDRVRPDAQEPLGPRHWHRRPGRPRERAQRQAGPGHHVADLELLVLDREARHLSAARAGDTEIDADEVVVDPDIGDPAVRHEGRHGALSVLPGA